MALPQSGALRDQRNNTMPNDGSTLDQLRSSDHPARAAIAANCFNVYFREFSV
jgi:hypothetical protein